MHFPMTSHDLGPEVARPSPVASPAPRGAFGYHGSKQRLARKILESMPPHHCWVELFGGSMAVTMAKKPAAIEVVNDLDGDIVNTFVQIRDNGERLAHLLDLTPYARGEFERARTGVAEDPMERARQFLVHAMMSVNGVMAGRRGGFSISNTYSREGREARVNRWCNYPARLAAVTERLKGVRIECRDGIGLLADYSNKPATLVYIDPPYLGNRASGYRLEAEDCEFHERLLQQARICACMILISGYESETYTALLREQEGWRKVVMDATTRGTKGEGRKRREVLWLNEAAATALQEGRVGVRLTDKEQKEGRINPPRGPLRKLSRSYRSAPRAKQLA